jgi:hypothetical protein
MGSVPRDLDCNVARKLLLAGILHSNALALIIGMNQGAQHAHDPSDEGGILLVPCSKIIQGFLQDVFVIGLDASISDPVSKAVMDRVACVDLTAQELSKGSMALGPSKLDGSEPSSRDKLRKNLP